MHRIGNLQLRIWYRPKDWSKVLIGGRLSLFVGLSCRFVLRSKRVISTNKSSRPPFLGLSTSERSCATTSELALFFGRVSKFWKNNGLTTSEISPTSPSRHVDDVPVGSLSSRGRGSGLLNVVDGAKIGRTAFRNVEPLYTNQMDGTFCSSRGEFSSKKSSARPPA